ncbi:MAG: lipid-A-disaccharide synthase [Lentisphaerae bacterium]|nr:lipid-A-disaccharide synthase [Lentisphaerota bacterium]
MPRSPSLMIIAGEVSGDMHGARLVRAIHAHHPEITCFGIGGEQMRAAGVETFTDISAMAVTGISEVLRKYRHLRRIFYDSLAQLRSRRPDAVILIDYPGFNLRFARRAHLMGFKTIYYICPQVWAWNRQRIPRMAATLDRLIAFFPFEAAHFDHTALQVDFVGHPLVDEIDEVRRQPHPTLPWQGTPHIALLPGSRDHEIERILPSMWAAAALIEEKHPEASFIIPVHSEAAAALVNRVLAGRPAGPTRSEIVIGHTRAVLAEARATLIASGTATLEASLLRCPMVITYQATPITYWLARALVKVKHIGLVNIVAEAEVATELLQYAATPHALAAALEPLISDNTVHAAALAALDDVNRRLGPPGGTDRAAAAVLDAISPRLHGPAS